MNKTVLLRTDLGCRQRPSGKAELIPVKQFYQMRKSGGPLRWQLMPLKTPLPVAFRRAWSVHARLGTQFKNILHGDNRKIGN
jgi:hypothetical protein